MEKMIFIQKYKLFVIYLPPFCVQNQEKTVNYGFILLQFPVPSLSTVFCEFHLEFTINFFAIINRGIKAESYIIFL